MDQNDPSTQTLRSLKRWIVFSSLLLLTIIIIGTVVAFQIPSIGKDDDKNMMEQLKKYIDSILFENEPDDVIQEGSDSFDGNNDDDFYDDFEFDTLGFPQDFSSSCDQVERSLDRRQLVVTDQTNINSLSSKIVACLDTIEIENDQENFGLCEIAQASDINQDGYINQADLKILLTFWGKGGIGDIDDDGFVNVKDLIHLLSNWGQIPSCMETFKFEKSSNKLNLGEKLSDIELNIDENDLPIALKNNLYITDDGEMFDYEQKIKMGDDMLFQHFADPDLNPGSIPEFGFHLDQGDHIYSYLVSFIDSPHSKNVNGQLPNFELTSIELLGNPYFIVDASFLGSNAKLDLVSVQEAVELTEGKRTVVTIDNVQLVISAIFIGGFDGTVVFEVNGVFQDEAREGETSKVEGIGIENIYFTVLDVIPGNTPAVHFLISDRLLTLENGQDIKIDGEQLNIISPFRMDVTITTSGRDIIVIEEILFDWQADDEVFLADNKPITMPVFETLRFYQNGFTTIKEGTTMINNGFQDVSIEITTEVEDGVVNFDLIYKDENVAGPIQGIGRNANYRLITSSNNTLLFDTDTDQWFVATWLGNDEAESYVLEVTVFENVFNETAVSIRSAAFGSPIHLELEIGEKGVIGEVQLKLLSADAVNNLAVLEISPAGNQGTTSFHELVTKEGMLIPLPVDCNINPCVEKGRLFPGIDVKYTQWFIEETSDGVIGLGKDIFLELGQVPSYPIELGIIGFDPDLKFLENSDFDNDMTAYLISPLATKVFVETFFEKDTTITYHGEEAFGNVYLSSFSSACSNGIDDDFDELTDFPLDPDCQSLDDDSELAEKQPDLWMRGLDISVKIQNDSLFEVVLNAEIRNIGSATAMTSLTEFIIEGYSSQTISTPMILPTQEVNIMAFFTLPAGQYTVKAITDSASKINEADETNNKNTVTFSLP